MIRRSITVATIALLLSVFLHVFWLFLSTEDQVADSAADGDDTELVDVGGGFEELAEPVEPVEPETAEAPEPPEPTEPVTSRALVASDNPQDTLTPDTGEAEVIEPNPSGVADAADTVAAEASEADDTGGEAQAPETATQEVEPVETEEVAQQQLVTPDATTFEPVEADIAEEVASAETVEAPEPKIANVPAIDIEIEPLDPDLPEIAAEDVEQETQAEETETAAVNPNAAVARSLRPPKTRPEAGVRGVFGAADQNERAVASRSRTVESPLTAFQRNGVDLIAQGLGGAQAASAGFNAPRGVGNSTATNYVGRVLVHLNRKPRVNRSVRGSARVYFQINSDGSLAWVRILNRSGTGDIDGAARAQVQSAAPFPKPPKGESQRLIFVYRNR